MDFQLEHLEMEFEAETWWFCSPHEYYKTTNFQLQTPSLNAPTGNSFFSSNVSWGGLTNEAGLFFAQLTGSGHVLTKNVDYQK